MLSLPRTGLAPGALGIGRGQRGGAARRATGHRRDRVTDEVAGYVVELVRRTRELPSVTLGASPRAAVHLLGGQGRRASAGARLRHPRRRRRDRARRAGPPARPDPRSRARRFTARDAVAGRHPRGSGTSLSGAWPTRPRAAPRCCRDRGDGAVRSPRPDRGGALALVVAARRRWAIRRPPAIERSLPTVLSLRAGRIAVAARPR